MAISGQMTSRREARRAQELAARRADAITGAAAVFSAKGFHDAQMAEIAAEAELSLATLYSLFKDGKEEIYQEVIRSAALEIRDVVQARVEAVDDPAERILETVDALFDCFEQHRDLMRILLSGTQGLPWRIRERMGPSQTDIASGFTAWVKGLCREAQGGGYLVGLDPDAFAASLIGAVTNAAASAVDARPRRSIARSGAAVRAIFARLLEREP